MPDFPPPAFKDWVLPFQVETPGFRGRLVRLGGAVATAIAHHNYPEAVASLVSEAMAMAAALASCLKYDGVFTAQLEGDGAVRFLVVDVTSDGDLRGYARCDPTLIASPSWRSGAGVAPLPRLMGAGRMAFTVDQPLIGDRYQGVTMLEGATLSECCHAYFRQSEQIETAITLCASGATSESPLAAGLMLQRLPDEDSMASDRDDDWRRAVILMSSVSPSELLAPELDAYDLLYRLFHEDGVRVFRPRQFRHRCRCSMEKVTRVLRAFREEDLSDLMVDGRLVVICEFCKADYRLDESALGRPLSSEPE